MKIELKEIAVRDIVKGYTNDLNLGVFIWMKKVVVVLI